jgi:hypothetical protein
MSSSYDLAIYIIAIATVLGYGYTVYATIAIRRKIAGSVYRKQALGLALVATFYCLNAVLPNYTGTTLDAYALLGALAFPLAFVMIFYWVDSSMTAARLADPLLRDTLHWSRLRLYIWAINISTTVFPVSYTVYLQIVTGGIPPTPPLFLLIPFLTPAYLSVGSGALVLLIEVRRIADGTLKRHLEWFGVYLVFIFVFGGLIGNGLGTYSIQLGNLVGGASNAVASLFLYRSARSLIPIYSMPGVESPESGHYLPSQ